MVGTGRMTSINLQSMRNYLSRSISSLNQNKLNGLLAEVDFRNYLNSLGFQDRVSVGGWIARSKGVGNFGRHTAVFFPETIIPNANYPTRTFSNPHHGLHTICAAFHQIGLKSYFCTPVINQVNDAASIEWHLIQLGVPTQQNFSLFPTNIHGFQNRTRRYNFLRNNTQVNGIPNSSVPEEFSKEHFRVTFSNQFMAEISDIDGVLWGQQFTYPIEIKEKTPATDRQMGEYFGLDVGPFVKLAFYSAKRNNLKSLFIVKEIDNEVNRNLVNWWYISYEKLAQFASWVPQGGGRNMQGGASSTVKIPKDQFQLLDINALNQL